MRQISTSTDVYAAIWAARQPGEDTEDDILRRVLRVTPAPKMPTPPASPKTIGFRDSRFGIELPEGFEVFRTYKHKEFRAKAVGGQWLLISTGDLYPSFNQLSRAIGAKVENAWQNWYFADSTGRRHLVDQLRAKTKPTI